MIAVFTTALLGPDVSVKQIGLGMAVAVLIDATIVRMILVPAVMELCGKANWWMPGRRHRRRPRLHRPGSGKRPESDPSSSLAASVGRTVEPVTEEDF
jgi:putative drug exporter of the RND superfamily